MKYENYYLNLDKVAALNSDSEKKQIHDYYRFMLEYSSDGVRTSMSESFFNTLFNNGYLKEVRDEKIQQILS
jgi:hypothetical protein